MEMREEKRGEERRQPSDWVIIFPPTFHRRESSSHGSRDVVELSPEAERDGEEEEEDEEEDDHQTDPDPHWQSTLAVKSGYYS